MGITPETIPYRTNDCFLIAAMRGVLHIPALRKAFYDHIPELQTFERNLDSTKLREFLSLSRDTQEDASEVFRLLADKINTTTCPLFFTDMITTERIDGRLIVERTKTFQIPLPIPDQEESIPLIDLLTTARFPSIPHGKGIAREYTHFASSPPDTLFLTIHRFTANQIPITTKIDIPLSLCVDKEFSITGEEKTYTPVYGVTHLGSSTEKGHYTAVMKIDGAWFLDTCWGDPIASIDEGSAMERLKDASIICLQAVDQKLPIEDEIPPPPSTPPLADRTEINWELFAQRRHHISSDIPNCSLAAVLWLFINIPDLRCNDILVPFFQEILNSSAKQKTPTAIRKNLFENKPQPDPQVVIELFGLPEKYSIKSKAPKEALPENVVGIICKLPDTRSTAKSKSTSVLDRIATWLGKSDESPTHYATFIKEGEQWKKSGFRLRFITSEQLAKDLKSVGATLILHDPPTE